MRKILTPRFFEQSTLTVARNLLGKYLVRRLPSGKKISAMITDVEVYDGFRDRASHAHKGKTKRNFVMFGPAGVWYVYFTYGIHWLLNAVCGKKGYPAAILIRSVAVSGGEAPKIKSHWSARSPAVKYILLQGPARVTKFFKIDGRFNNKKADKKTKLWIENRGIKINTKSTECLPRIGVTYAGKIWATKPYRLTLYYKFD